MNKEIIKDIKRNEWIEVKPIHCHKRLRENTLVEKVRAVSEDKTATEVLHRFIPQELNFFFDHEIDHLPGMLEACAIRQACLAVAHLIYRVPIDYVAMMEFLNIKFYNYGELNIPVHTKGKLISISRNKNKIIIDLEGLMIQDTYPLLKAEGRLIAFSPALAAKTRHKKTYSI